MDRHAGLSRHDPRGRCHDGARCLWADVTPDPVAWLRTHMLLHHGLKLVAALFHVKVRQVLWCCRVVGSQHLGHLLLQLCLTQGQLVGRPHHLARGLQVVVKAHHGQHSLSHAVGCACWIRTAHSSSSSWQLTGANSSARSRGTSTAAAAAALSFAPFFIWSIRATQTLDHHTKSGGCLCRCHFRQQQMWMDGVCCCCRAHTPCHPSGPETQTT